MYIDFINNYMTFLFIWIFRFAAQRTLGDHIPTGLITFDTEQVDAFNVLRGEFQVKTQGLYVFSFNASIYDIIEL